MTEAFKPTSKTTTNQRERSQLTNDTHRKAAVDQEKGCRSQKTDEGAKHFGGLKKGFLTAKCKPSNDNERANDRPPKCPPNSDEMPHIRKKSPDAKPHSLEIPEVQEAMKDAAPLLANREWVTDDLLEKIERHPLLSKAFRDPSLSQVLAEFQRNPETILKAAQGNPEMMQFLKEFSSLMGEHFTAFSSSKGPKRRKEPEGKLIAEVCTSDSNTEELKFKELIQRPDIQRVLLDEDIQRLIATLRSDPDQAQRMLQYSSAEFREKVRVLVDNGILGLQQTPIT